MMNKILNKFNLNKMTQTILGKGVFSCVVYPSFNMPNNREIVGKIGTDALNEFDRIYNLPKNGPYKYDTCKVFNLTPKQSEDILNKSGLKIDQNVILSELCIPYIHGKTFRNFISEYSESPALVFGEFSSYYDEDSIDLITYEEFLKIDKERKLILFDHWLEILASLIDFYNEVKYLNTHYSIFHNDINPGNIMYDGNKFYLIDWAPVIGFGHYDNYGRDKTDDNYEPEHDEDDDNFERFKIDYPDQGDIYKDYRKGNNYHDAIDILNYFIIPFIKMGLFTNLNIKNWLIKNSICKDYIETDEELFNNMGADVMLLSNEETINSITSIIENSIVAN